MAVATAPRNRTRVPSTVTVDRWDEAQVELAARRQEAIAFCDALEPRLERLHGATVHLGPVAEQLCAGALYLVARFRARNEL